MFWDNLVKILFGIEKENSTPSKQESKEFLSTNFISLDDYKEKYIRD